MSSSQTPSVRRKDPVEGQPTAEAEALTADEVEALRENAEETVSTPGGFKNDPDDPTNPNEAIERHRRKLRP